MRKIITLCGSYKFQKEIIEAYKKLTEEGNIVLFPAMGCDEHEKEYYMNLHFDKILLSDAIYVVDVNGYIGDSVKREIKVAKDNGIEVIYLEPIKS